MEITNNIKKVTLNKNRVLKIEFNEVIKRDDGTETVNTTGTTYGHLVHKDLINALDELKPHLAMLCEQTENDKLRAKFGSLPAEKVKKIVELYSIASFTLGKNGEGVSIGGGKVLNNGEFLSLDSPHQDDDDRYEWFPDLSMAMDAIKSEVQLYMDGKEAEAVNDPNQLQLELEKNNNEL